MRPITSLDLLNTLGVKEISELSKLSKSYISQVKKGKRPPSTRLLDALDYLRKKISSQYLAPFLKSRQVMGVTGSTLRFYSFKLGRFLLEVDPDTATRQDIEQFLVQFDNPGNRHTYYRAIKTF